MCVGYMVFTGQVEFLQTAHFSNSYRFVFCRGSTANVDGTHGNTRMACEFFLPVRNVGIFRE